MQFYGVNLSDGMIFEKRESYELFFFIQELDFGKKVNARFCGSGGKIEAFRIKSKGMKIFADLCLVGSNVLLGFLSQKHGKITIEREEDEYIGYVQPYEKRSTCADLDSFVILEGQSEQFLIEQHLNLIAAENMVKIRSTPFSAQCVDLKQAKSISTQVSEENSLVLILRDQEKEEEEFLRICREKGFIPGIKVSQDIREIQRLQEMGFKFFVISFERDCRGVAEQIRMVLKDSFFIAEGLSILSGVGLVDGLIFQKPLQFTELIDLALLNRVVCPYVKLRDFDEKILKLCGALKIGVIFENKTAKVDYAISHSIHKISDTVHEISYLGKNNVCRRMVVADQLLEDEPELNVRLVKKVKIREDGRSFNFYSEG
ncbi:MAG: hypothetical protein WHT65_09475 [Pseudothermotoga sp.]